MTDPMDMTEEEFRLYQARKFAAGVYRKEGFSQFADRVEAGLEDECSQMRLARFFIDPSPEPSRLENHAYRFGEDDGYYCTVRWDVRHQKVRVTAMTGHFADLATWMCPACQATYG